MVKLSLHISSAILNVISDFAQFKWYAISIQVVAADLTTIRKWKDQDDSCFSMS